MKNKMTKIVRLKLEFPHTEECPVNGEAIAEQIENNFAELGIQVIVKIESEVETPLTEAK